MKKKIYYMLSCLLMCSLIYAKPITPVMAKTVAQNFFKKNSTIEVYAMDLMYTESSANGLPQYYIFNVNTTEGFVIVTGDDAGLIPVIGYSTEAAFVFTEAKSTISTWLRKRKEEVVYIQEHNIQAGTDAQQAWSIYDGSTQVAKLLSGNQVNATGVAPIVQSKWNQSPYYNALCPGGSVTGCVATAMAQIMRYWQYPLQGTSSSSYTHTNYGLQSANYGTATYNWSNMPLVCNSPNNDVALINYHCGVSVEMDYSPTGSGANVVGGYPSAQYSYKNYFKYNPSTLQGKYRNSYTDANWIAYLKSDLDIGRPMQYVGWDPNTGGGHTWVCDGYDQNDYLHMNWGWGGSGDGFFALNNMAAVGSNFSLGHQVVKGIVPIAASTNDAGVSAVFSPSGSYCASGNSFTPSIKIQNFGSANLTSCTINYSIDGGSVQTQNWTGSLVTGQFEMVSLPSFNMPGGTHTITCYTSNPNNASDGNANNNQSSSTFNVVGAAALPFVESFENASPFPSEEWASTHTKTNGVNWTIGINSGATGTKSAMINNMDNVAGNISTLDHFMAYDFSNNASPSMTFKIAYQRKTTANNDRLQLYVSTNCGSNWVLKWSKAGSALTSVSATSSTPFIPSSTQYTTQTVNLITLAYKPSVTFRWVFNADTSANGAGNNLYLDDINILAANGISSNENSVGIDVYPNPTADNINLNINLNEKHQLGVNLTDVLGRTVESLATKTYEAGESHLILNGKSCRPGVYMVNVDIDGQRITRKVLIQ